MSWSSISFGQHWAHAHDNEQIMFMSHAPECLAQLPGLSGERWLHEWAAYWIDHRINNGNGCTDLALDEHLDSAEKVRVFRAFLNEYKRWLEATPDEELLDVAGYPMARRRVVWFADLIGATIDGDTSFRDLNGRERVSPIRPNNSLERTREG
jgi:hypothetical protein